MNAVELFKVLGQDKKLKKYLNIIASKPRYPVIYDSERTVLSLPPIINSEATKISMGTRNIFIEITGMDLNKIKICLDVLTS